MIRLRLVPIAALALATSGCSTFTDDDVAVEVGTEQLSYDEFVELATGQALGGADVASTADRIGRVTVDETLNAFIVNALLRADLNHLDIDVPASAEPADDSSIARLQSDFEAAITTWLALPPETMLDGDVAALYGQGPETSGMVCSSHILTERADEAEAAIARLEAGEPFGEVAADVSTDPGSAGSGGWLGCMQLGSFNDAFIPEFVEGALALDVGELSRPIESEFGFHVIRLVPFDELDPSAVGTEMVQAMRFPSLTERIGVSVDPRLGTWSPFTGVTALG